MLKYKFIGLILLLLPIVFAQEAQLQLEHIGYGASTTEIHISIKNTGSVSLTEITILDNGVEYKSTSGVAPPGTTFGDILYLDEGHHKIEATSPEGAYDSLELDVVNIPPNTAETTVLQQQKQMTESYIWIGILAVVVIVCMVFFLAFRRPKL